MKAKHLRILFALVILEGILADFFLLRMEFDPGRGRIFNYETLRLGLAGMAFLAWLALLALLILSFFDPKLVQHICVSLDEKLAGEGRRLFSLQGFLILALVALIEITLLTYLSIPIPFRPIIFWGALTCFQAWLGLRLIYAKVYRPRPSLISSLIAGWRAWMPVQRKVFVILAILGLIYFLAFIPANLQKDKQGQLIIHPDEGVIYPDVTRVLVVQDTFGATVQNLLGNWQWWYGYPYLVISALVLLIPRLIFGNGFAQQTQINLLLLRQLISVLPMILSIFMLVYIVTRFKSTLRAVSMFVFLLLIPGVVRYNHRFWHPDSLILLLVVLTIFFLQRDQLRFKRDFYLAAVTCGLAVAIKLWGFFFFLTIAGYLLAGLLRKILTFKKLVLAGLVFILVMSATVVLSSPSLLVPYSFQSMLTSIQNQNQVNAQGYNEPDPEGVYRPGLANWMRYFEMFYMRSYFFYFAFFALAAGSLVGTESYLNRILLSWCLVTTIYLVTFLAVKSFHYMLPIMVPLYASVFLFPAIGEDNIQPGRLSFLNRPLTRKILWAVMIGICVSQFVFNIVSILTSPATIGILNKL